MVGGQHLIDLANSGRDRQRVYHETLSSLACTRGRVNARAFETSAGREYHTGRGDTYNAIDAVRDRRNSWWSLASIWVQQKGRGTQAIRPSRRWDRATDIFAADLSGHSGSYHLETKVEYCKHLSRNPPCLLSLLESFAGLIHGS